MEVVAIKARRVSDIARVLFLLPLVVAFWPTYRWYWLRLQDGGDEPYGLVALLSALILVVLRAKENVQSVSLPTVPIGSLVLLCCYVLTYSYVSPLPRALLAVILLAYTLQKICVGRQFELSLVALFVLSLPIISSLQFFCGYPLRAVSAAISSQIISLLGFHTEAHGTLLVWAGETISVDAPCSGVKMLWAGLYANFLLAALMHKSNLVSWISYWVASLAVFTANVLRITLLFFSESGIVTAPEWFHDVTGLFTFVVALIVITGFHTAITAWERC